jgi:hypothetical protein
LGWQSFGYGTDESWRFHDSQDRPQKHDRTIDRADGRWRLRMRLVAAVVVASGLAGCTNGTADFELPSGTPSNAECRAVATERASEAAAADFDDETQKAVFTRTYSDCAAWYLKQGNPLQPQSGDDRQ